MFALLRKIALHEPVDDIDLREAPYAPVRWVNQWDNLDGTIERGYGGRSIFFDERLRSARIWRAVNDFARLLASLGINGCAINNVNADPRLITAEFLPQVARIAEVFRPLGRLAGALGRFQQSPKDRRARHIRSARSAGCRVVEGEDGRDLPRRAGPRRVRGQGRLRRTRRAVGVRADARRRRQRDRAGA